MHLTRRWLWMIVGGALGCAMLWWSLRIVSLDLVIDIVHRSSPRYLALAVLASGAFIAVKTWRWQILLHPVAPVPFAELYGPVNVGTAANLVISHVGELARARILNRGRHRIPMSTVLASIGSERILDLGTIVLLSLYLLLDGDGQFDTLLSGMTDTAAVVSTVLVIALASMALQSQQWLRWIDVVTRSWPERQRNWVRKQFLDLLGGFRSLYSPTLLLKAFVASLLQWLLIAFALWCCARAIDVTLQPSAAILVLVVMVFGLTLPTAPGYLGTTQLAFIIALAVFGISRSLAFAMSVLYSAFVVLPMFAFGALAFLRGRGWATGSGGRPDAA